MTDKSDRKTLLLWLAVCLSAPATVTLAAAQTADAPKAGSAQAPPVAPVTAPPVAPVTAAPVAPVTAAPVAPVTAAPVAPVSVAPSHAAAPTAEQTHAANSTKSNDAADSQSDAAGFADNGRPARHAAKAPDGRHVQQDRMSDNQRRHADEGYYGNGAIAPSDNQQRHTDEGYYSEVLPYAAPPPEAKPVASPLTAPIQVGPPPLIVPAVGTGAPGGRKFDDDTGGTGSITATRHAKQAKDFMASGHYDLAKNHFRESLAVSPEQADLYPDYWESCSKTDDWGEGRRALEKLFDLDAGKRKLYCWAYGETWFQLKNYDKAVPVLKEALKYGVHEGDIHNDLLKIALHQHSMTDIPVEYAAVIKLNPGDAKTQLDFANWLEVQGRHADAINHYRAAVNLSPGDGALAARLGYMLMYYNKAYKDAIGYYHRAIAADPANAARYQENIHYAEAQVQTQAAGNAPTKRENSSNSGA